MHGGNLHVDTLALLELIDGLFLLDALDPSLDGHEHRTFMVAQFRKLTVDPR